MAKSCYDSMFGNVRCGSDIGWGFLKEHEVGGW